MVTPVREPPKWGAEAGQKIRLGVVGRLPSSGHHPPQRGKVPGSSSRKNSRAFSVCKHRSSGICAYEYRGQTVFAEL